MAKQMSYTTYGVLHTFNIKPMRMVVYNEKKCGPNYCKECQTKGSFEGIFYGLCTTHHEIIGTNDNHGCMKMFEFIQEIQKCINDARADYPTDEYGIVKEAIESGHYILDLYTKSFYERKYQCCSECNAYIDVKTIDKRGYCKTCQNPEYDPVWPKGD